MEPLNKIDIGYGLYVLSASENGKDNACIINTFMQVESSEPFSCVISVNKETLTHKMILASKNFNLSVLAINAPFSIFERFGFQSGRDADKFNGYEKHIRRSENGLLYTTEATNAFISFTVAEIIDFNTHTLFKSIPTKVNPLSNIDSLTYGYYLKNVKPKPSSTRQTGYRCIICNFIYEGEPLPVDYICPICKHGAVDFVKQ